MPCYPATHIQAILHPFCCAKNTEKDLLPSRDSGTTPAFYTPFLAPLKMSLIACFSLSWGASAGVRGVFEKKQDPDDFMTGQAVST